MLILLVAFAMAAVHLGLAHLLAAEDYPSPFSFSLPTQIGALDAANGGCCPFGNVPLPHAHGLAKPSLIGLGAHKAGTSYLFNLLKLHPGFLAP